MSEVQITMSVSGRIYYACQLDACAGHYGLTEVPSNGRKGTWYIGTENAWRKLADDVDFRRDSGWSSDCRTSKSDGLHGRINKKLAKAK
jgi:hypothetical protein